MDAILLMVIPFAAYLIAYHTYGKFLAKKIFHLNDNNQVPSAQLNDGKDYVPTKRGVIFGHHFTSIAGTGPIVGPAIGIIWGWLPAILWVLIGSILMGAVHDLGALVLSLRNQGKSISEITASYIGSRVRYIFFSIVFIALLIVIAIFGLVIAVIFFIFPQSVLAVWMQIPIAMVLGWVIYKKKLPIIPLTLLAVLAMYITVYLGHMIPLEMPSTFWGIPSTGLWTIILLSYAFIASTLPVTVLLQPRDYINAWQLLVAMAILILSVFASGIFKDLHIVAPALNINPKGAPPIMPFLFITIACGAISGFHSLVSSGTTSKQLEKESDALFVGYGSMLTEGALATLVIVAVAAGIGLTYTTATGDTLTGSNAWKVYYSSWTAIKGLGSKINAVVIGSANMMETIGIPKVIGTTIMGVFIASFAGTTLDSATRIQRYIISEIFTDLKVPSLSKKYPATAIAVLSASILAFSTGADGKGALKLWPLFGAVNQLLAALALSVITIYLKKKAGLKFLISGIPAVIMIIITLYSATLNEINFIMKGSWMLSLVNAAILILALWIIIEGILSIKREKLTT